MEEEIRIEIKINIEKMELMKMIENGKIVLEASAKNKSKDVIAEKIKEYAEKLNGNKDIMELAEIVREDWRLKTSVNISAIIKIHIIRRILNINKWKIISIIYNNNLKDIFKLKHSPMTVYNVLHRTEMYLADEKIDSKLKEIIDRINPDIDVSIVEIRCPYCNSDNITRVGVKKGKDGEIKIYKCISCGKKFTADMHNNLDPSVKGKIVELWMEENKPYDSIAEIIKFKMGKEIDAEKIENVIDEYLIENLKDMPQKQKEIILRRLVFRYNNLSMNEIVKTLDKKYGCRILLRTVVNWLRERAIIKKYWDIIGSMAKIGKTAKDISYWLEKNEGIFVDPVFLEDDLKRMGVENEMLNMWQENTKQKQR